MTSPDYAGISGISIASRDVDASLEAWQRLAGAPGASPVVVGGIVVGIGPAGNGPDGLVGVTLACPDVMQTQRLLTRRGLPTNGTVVDVGGTQWRLAGTTGVMRLGEGADIDGIDHVLVHTDDPERAAASYGARLGLDLRLDRTLTRLRMRGLFFRCGGTVVEVVARLDDDLQVRASETPGRDAFAGLAWAVQDIAATRGRLLEAGVEVTEVRVGRKEGTQVATVHDDDLCVPTLLIQPAHEPRETAATDTGQG